jgi:alkane 1-monooxygenase
MMRVELTKSYFFYQKISFIYANFVLMKYKYLVAYTIPLAAAIGLYFGGIHAWTTLVYGFVVVPILDTLIPMSTENHSSAHEEPLSRSRYYDFILYLHVPLVYVLVYWYLHQMQTVTVIDHVVIGQTFSLGIIIGTIGINLAHELGHRSSRFEQFLCFALLLPALYQHFFIEHNRGHHKYVATPLDPATSRLGEPIYLFWWRSIAWSFIGAWKLEADRLEGRSAWTWSNQLIRFLVYQVTYLAVVYAIFGLKGLLAAMAIALIGVLLLESVNYIEHYGLVRRKLDSGRYEPVLPAHSWNSDHEMGRIVLFELTRHSDHHFKATRKYQILRHLDESPQLATGYPGSILMALVPPLWRRVMDPRVASWNANRGV